MDTQRVAIVTGGSRGIGRAIAVELASAGLHVIITYKTNDEQAQQTVEAIQASGGAAEAVKFDVADCVDAARHMDAICSRFQNIEVLVNNAGITADGLFMLMSETEWSSVIDTSLRGFYNVTQPVLKKMAVNHAGAIIAISSVSALMGNRGQTNYAAAKAGLIAACRSLAAEVARTGIRVNVVAPGLLRDEPDGPLERATPLEAALGDRVPVGHAGCAADVVRAVLFLVSTAAEFVTGQVIEVAGGARA